MFTLAQVTAFFSHPATIAVLSAAAPTIAGFLLRRYEKPRAIAQTVANYNAALLAAMKKWEAHRIGGVPLPGPDKLEAVLADMREFFEAAGVHGKVVPLTLEGVKADIEALLPLVDKKQTQPAAEERRKTG